MTIEIPAKIMTSKEAIEILKKLAPDISQNGFFPNKTSEEIREMGANAGKRILEALKKQP